jgi:hypothetical protein
MSDALRPDEPVEGEYTDSELPLDAELPKDELEDVGDDDLDVDDGLGDTEEVDVDVVEVDDDDYPSGRDTSL